MKKLLSFLVIILIIGTVSQASAITVTNESFNDADASGINVFDHWTQSITGDGAVIERVTSTENPDSGDTSAVYSDDYYLSTDPTHYARISGGGTLSNAISWEAGDYLTFDWAFLENDGNVDDYGYFNIIETGEEDALLDDSIDLHTSLLSWGGTGWLEYSYQFSSAGSGSITFGLHDATTGHEQDSMLLVDNIATTSPVPEPATMLLFGLGLLGIAGAGRKKA